MPFTIPKSEVILYSVGAAQPALFLIIAKKVKTKFEHFIIGATIVKVNPLACIPILDTRPCSASEIERIILLFSSLADTADSNGVGILTGQEMTLIVHLTGSFEYLLKYDFCSIRLLSEQQTLTPV